MKKKIILIVATLSICLGAYLALSSGDRVGRPPPARDASQAVRQFVTPANLQSSQTLSQAEMNFSPGDQTRVRIYDENSGRLKYQLEAESWEPVSNNDFRLKKLLIQIFMPKGEITYISADEAEVTLARKSKSRFEPRSGQLKKNVKVTIDRTTAKWREANPQLADRDAHPDDLIYIDLDEARFDLEQAELRADGPIRLDSVDARIENVRGLTVQWNQVDNRIDVLRFAHGGTMALRRGGKMIDFGMPGTERAAGRKPGRGTGGTAADKAAAMKVPRARAMQPMSIEAPRADEAAEQIRREGGLVVANRPRTLATPALPGGGAAAADSAVRTPQALASDIGTLKAEARAAAGGEPIVLADKDDILPTRRRVHTYRAVFTNKVVVEQMDGLKSLGRMDADKLEINFDFGKKQKELAGAGGKDVPAAPLPGHAPSAAPGEKQASKPATPTPVPTPTPQEDKTRLVLTWDGPLEMRPLRVDPAQQTGERFDAVATGAPVKLKSEQGEGHCDQLVYRHERKQAWLSAAAGKQVELAVSANRKLVGQEVFFDQSRGLARVEGAGVMLDTGAAESGSPLAEMPSGRGPAPAEGSPAKPKKPREPVEIRWSRGVDIELGARPVERVHPSTGAKETRQREYLRRAWFHGDVAIHQGGENLTAEEVAVTFGAPRSAEEVADHIQHLNMSGKVRLGRGEDVISAEQLDAQMIVTPDGRNIPRLVDAAGDVVARQGRREILARKMHVVMGLVPGRKMLVRGDQIVPEKPRVGIEALDAEGDVFISDPDNNLKIRDADSLRSVMRNGEQLVRATILGAKPDKLARVRTGDVAIHGHRIEIDADREMIDVPGAGRAYMLSQRDFGGRRLSRARRVEPAAVRAGQFAAVAVPWTPLAPSALAPDLAAGAARYLVPAAIAALSVSDRDGDRTRVAWDDEMHFRLGENYGVFVGRVRTDSETFALSCDKLTVRFAQGTPPAEKPAPRREPESGWNLIHLVSTNKPPRNPAPTTNTVMRKRPASIVAEGNARALASEYVAEGADGHAGRLLSRMQIAGRQITADLLRERMSVPCEGSLLIEDYKFEPAGRRVTDRKAGPLMSAARGDGPSQTVVFWKNSMDYYVDQNLIAFDKEVDLRHRSGRQIAALDRLAQAMRINPADLKHLREGRQATLTCGSLLLEFRESEGPAEEGGSRKSAARATDLERLVAKRSVHLQEGTRSIMGDYLQYLRSTDEVLVEGGPGAEAGIYDQDEREQRMNMWRGPTLIWNRSTNRIEAPRATIRSSRR